MLGIHRLGIFGTNLRRARLQSRFSRKVKFKMYKFQNAIKVFALAVMLSATAGVAHAQSTEETVGALLGGTLGAVIGGEVDNKGSSTEGKIIGGLVGGSLGYIIGGELENDRDIRRRYDGRAGEFYRYDGRAYRRYRDADYGYVGVVC